MDRENNLAFSSETDNQEQLYLIQRISEKGKGDIVIINMIHLMINSILIEVTSQVKEAYSAS
ncbi:3807_t:CDS:2 [Funneliformis caledonium]|uniref:3807_t:CDS:1 n=1 Tax=Funneliformis caledonium TaxID=1117310 RepID=A0A9N8W3T1_9GLOM|nr:3807_t:CDS:2 [Funneliformis caledonium]